MLSYTGRDFSSASNNYFRVRYKADEIIVTRYNNNLILALPINTKVINEIGRDTKIPRTINSF